ncbi:hypothetical protein [Methylomonas rapida]|uniref:Uncharacterized protein n=1 Tax=Methylomonas rapida TaxID=2963939 RepID=A0ABY7GGS6_9GAMM|nr:hypothetical protein [Methylomonas rapida]WAR44162.1 hypothetical protein NM686_017565 [Methylomonas rapida]
MFKLNLKLLFGVAAMLLWSQQNAWADGWRHAERMGRWLAPCRTRYQGTGVLATRR